MIPLLEMWPWIKNKKDRFIFIQVSPVYRYWTRMGVLGKEEDGHQNPENSMWRWIHHLRNKRWWSPENEKRYKLIAEKMIIIKKKE